MSTETIVACVFILISLLTYFFAGYFSIPKAIRKPLNEETMYIWIHMVSFLVVIGLAAYLIQKGKIPTIVATLIIVGLGIVIVPLTAQKTWMQTQ